MAGELVGALLKRHTVVEGCAEVWESKPEPSSADASQWKGVNFGSAPSAKEWMAKLGSLPEEDPLREALAELLKSRGPRPAHVPRQNTADSPQLQGLTQALAELQRQLQAEQSDLGTRREDLARREAEIADREQQLKAELEEQRQKEERRKNYPQPEWLEDVEGTINVGIVGNSGVGKSLLINRLRRVHRDAEGWAPVGVKETTQAATMYPFPGNKRIRLWDLPGAGTVDFPRETYIQTMGLRYFDSVLIVTAGRFTTTETELRAELEEHEVPFFMVRTKVDIDVWNNKEDNGLGEMQTLKQIRDDLCHFHGVERPYLVSSRDANLYDMHRLRCDAFPGLKKHLDENAPVFSPGEKDWGDAWAMPTSHSELLSGIQGQWRDKYDGTLYIVDGSQAHCTLHDGRTAIVTLVESDKKVWWCHNWHIGVDSMKKSKRSCELRWAPTDLKLKPLVWRWIS